ncbi:MAG: hypothetical protein B7Y70_00020 [Rhizobiales bacterium 35-68-8]|nr:MAG: hypothetical protein B7Y70_00020 [Rhizobiales bacterium 35-68-8]
MAENLASTRAVLPPLILARSPATTRIEVSVREPLQSMCRQGTSPIQQVEKLLHQRRVHLPSLMGEVVLVELDLVKQATLGFGQLNIRLSHKIELSRILQL